MDPGAILAATPHFLQNSAFSGDFFLEKTFL